MLRSTLIALAACAGSLAAVAHADTAQVTGTATYLERIALPKDAVLEVELLDVTESRDRGTLMSGQRFALTGVPQGFTLSYDPALIDEAMVLAIAARIEKGGNTLFRTTSSMAVLTQGNGNSVDLVMQPVAVSATAGIDGTAWRASEIMGQPLGAEKRPEIRFADGRVSVATGCNTFNGPIDVGERDMSFSEQMAGTMMACPPPMDEQERAVLDVLPQVQSYLRSGNELGLIGAGGILQMRLSLLP